MLINIPVSLETMQQLIIKCSSLLSNAEAYYAAAWRRFEGLCCRKIIKNIKKRKYFEKLLLFVKLKS